MKSKVNCHSCKWNDWSLPSTRCEGCIGFHKWEEPRKVVCHGETKCESPNPEGA
jgi:hypothetical protein